MAEGETKLRNGQYSPPLSDTKILTVCAIRTGPCATLLEVMAHLRLDLGEPLRIVPKVLRRRKTAAAAGIAG